MQQIRHDRREKGDEPRRPKLHGGVPAAKCDFSGGGNGGDHLEATGDIGEQVLDIVVTETNFRCGRTTGRLARDVWGSLDSGVIAAVADNSPRPAVIIAQPHGVVWWSDVGRGGNQSRQSP